MACENINKSRLLGCKTGFSGIKAVGFLPFANLTLSATDMFEGVGLTGSIYKFYLKNDGNTYTEEIDSNRQTHTTVYNGTLNLVLPSLDRETRDQVKLLAYGNPQIFLELYNGQIQLIGAELGADLSGGSITTGGARTEMSGYSLTFTTQERRPLVWLGVTGSTAYNAAINLTGAITPA